MCGWRTLPEPLILAPEIHIILMTTAIYRYSESEAASSSGDSSEEYSKSEKRGELHMRVGFTADDTIRESMPEKEGYFEQRSVNEGKKYCLCFKSS